MDNTHQQGWNVRTKILATLIPAMLLSILTVAGAIFYSFNALHNDYKLMLEDKAFALSESTRRLMTQNLTIFPLDSMPWMDTYLQGVVSNNVDISYAFIADRDRQLLYHSDGINSDHKLGDAEYRQVQYDTIFKRLMFPVGDYYEVVVPMLQFDQIIGTIHIGLKKELIDSRLFEMLGLSIGVLVLSWATALYLIYFLLQRHIIRPISEMADKASLVSRDRDLTQVIEVRSGDELGVLSRAFNAMIASLRQHYDDLEQKVAERTRELQQRNQQLNSEIQERLRLEASLRVAKEGAEAASQAKSDFVARMSHEIRTPMNAVIGLSLLALRTELNAKQRDYLEKIRVASHSLLGIINDILDFSKIEAGKLSLENIPFNPGELVHNLSCLSVVKTDNRDVTISLAIDADVPVRLMGDPLRLGQVLNNLMSNAIKFTPMGRIELSVSLLSRQEHVVQLRFQLRDTGIGMTATQMADLFSSFYQADGTITRKYGGTGLGLAISRQLVEMMGGVLMVASEPGIGTTFHFELSLGIPTPALALPELSPTVSGRPLAGIRGARVLVVEDNLINQQVAREFLEQMGLQVDMAADGRAGLAMATSKPYDLVLMDVMMPEMDGLEATRRIRAHGCTDLPIVAMTAHAMVGDYDQSRAAGMNDHLSKPIEPEMLEQMLLRWIPPSSSRLLALADPVGASGMAIPDVVLPEIPGINQSLGLRRVGGSRSLFRELLLGFAADNHDFAARLQSARSGEDAREALRLAHTLKGSAAALGAEAIAEAAGVLYDLLKGGEGENLAAELASLDGMLSGLCERIRGQLTVVPAVAPCHGEASPAALLDELADYLRQGDARAEPLALQLQLANPDNLDSAGLDALLEAVQDLEFASALEMISKIKAEAGVTS